jgi:hypothetical protein
MLLDKSRVLNIKKHKKKNKKQYFVAGWVPQPTFCFIEGTISRDCWGVSSHERVKGQEKEQHNSKLSFVDNFACLCCG